MNAFVLEVPLHEAAQNHELEVCQELGSYGADTKAYILMVRVTRLLRSVLKDIVMTGA
jgi:hypothetical protein